MKLIAGVDIGNSTTEVCIGSRGIYGRFKFLASGTCSTTGIKGTLENVPGIRTALDMALSKAGMNITDVDLIRLNEAAPVIGDTAMETITETVITESTMIGHNPSTPGGVGIGIGEIVNIKDIKNYSCDKAFIAIVPEDVSYEKAANMINKAEENGITVSGAIVQKDEGVLICNRLIKKIPVVDEVKYIDRVSTRTIGAVEVAETGYTIKTLSNPYGIASIFNLNADETRQVTPIARSLVGNRSAVVIKTPSGEVKERIIPSGTLYILGENSNEKVNVDAGAEAIMKAVESIHNIVDVDGESGTNIGGMISSVKSTMSNLTGESLKDIRIRDFLAVDTTLPVKVHGGIAGETFMENAVAAAAMVKVAKLPMLKVAEKLMNETGVLVEVAGVEAVMASLGAFTTPGVKLPIAVLDLGGGSTDAALLDEKGNVRHVHLAGAGELVTMLINAELGLNDRALAEEIKKCPCAKVESLFHIRMENREIKFYDSPLDSRFFGRVVVLKDEMIPIYKDLSVEKVVEVRKSAKRRVFIQNAVRGLKAVAPMNNLRNIPNIVLIGGSAMDFEIPEMIMEELSKYRIVCGRGNVRGVEGPRNAVATGLVMSYSEGR